MKKLWILFTALALLAALPAVADVTTGAVFYWWGITDLSESANSDALMQKARVKISGNIDEFNSISTEFRYGNGDTLVLVPAASAGDWDPAVVRVKTFKLDTDITGALGLKLPVTIKTQVGVWESDFEGWWYATRAGWTYVNGAQYDQNQGHGAAQLDIGFGPATFHYYQNMDFGSAPLMIGLDGTIGPVAAWVSYKAPSEYLGEGALAVEAKYEGKFGDLAISAYPAINYHMDPSLFAWNFGVKAGYKMLTVALGAGGSDVEAFDVLEAEVGAAMGKAALWVAFYDQLSIDSAFGLDIMASYKFGAATFYLGYVLVGDGTPANAIPVDGWEWETRAGGLYAGVKATL